MPDEYTNLKTELALVRQAHSTFVERYEREKKQDEQHIQHLEEEIAEQHKELQKYKVIMDKGKTVAYVSLGLVGLITSILVLRKELISFFVGDGV